MTTLEIKDLIAMGYSVKYDPTARYPYAWHHIDGGFDNASMSSTPYEAWQEAARMSGANFTLGKPFPSAAHAWRRIAKAIASYGGEFDSNFYRKLLEQDQCVAAIAELQEDGVQFKKNDCYKWSFELCGSFEVTHPKYQPPIGCRLPEADVLYFALNGLLGIPNEEKLTPEFEESLSVADYEEVIRDHKRKVRELDEFLNGNKAARQASLIDIIKQLVDQTQMVWLLKDSLGEHVMMCPIKPADDFINNVQDKAGVEVTVEEYLLFKR